MSTFGRSRWAYFKPFRSDSNHDLRLRTLIFVPQRSIQQREIPAETEAGAAAVITFALEIRSVVGPPPP